MDRRIIIKLFYYPYFYNVLYLISCQEKTWFFYTLSASTSHSFFFCARRRAEFLIFLYSHNGQSFFVFLLVLNGVIWSNNSLHIIHFILSVGIYLQVYSGLITLYLSCANAAPITYINFTKLSFRRARNIFGWSLFQRFIQSGHIGTYQASLPKAHSIHASISGSVTPAFIRIKAMRPSRPLSLSGRSLFLTIICKQIYQVL